MKQSFKTLHPFDRISLLLGRILVAAVILCMALFIAVAMLNGMIQMLDKIIY